MSNKNKQTPPSAENKTEMLVPYTYVNQTATGGMKIVYDDENNPQDAFDSDTAANGSRSQRWMNGREGEPLDGNHSHGDVRNSSRKSSFHSSGTHSGSSTGTKSGGVRDDMCSQEFTCTAGNGYKLGTTEYVFAGKNCAECFYGSDSTKFQITSGDKVQKHKGNMFQFVENDYGLTIGKNKYENVKGEFGLHIQDGNWDTKVDGGEAKFEVQNKITFKVGTSTIVMEPGKITITADRIDLNP